VEKSSCGINGSSYFSACPVFSGTPHRWFPEVYPELYGGFNTFTHTPCQARGPDSPKRPIPRLLIKAPLRGLRPSLYNNSDGSTIILSTACSYFIYCHG